MAETGWWNMNGCIYCTKDNECELWTDGKHKSFCDPDCKDKHPSNADRIRNMTDEELAREFTRLDMFCCPVSGVTCANEPKCQDCFKRWLKQEVSDAR